MNILYLNHDFFEYDKAISAQINNMGHNVFSYKYVRMPNHFELNKCNNEIGSAYTLACHNKQKKILNEIKRKKIVFDTVLVTAGHMLEENLLISLKKMYPTAKFVWYLWDNVASVSCYETNRFYFDTIISFDKIEAYEKGMEYLPLFYVYEKRNMSKLYDLSYIGTYQKEREELCAQIAQCELFKKKYIYLYQKKGYNLVEQVYKAYSKMRNKSELTDTHVFDRKLDYRETINIIAQSKIVLDICYSFQTGLSIRTFEAMATRSKLITTNKSISKYDFYNPNNILIIAPHNLGEIPESFVTSEYEDVDEEIFRKYSIQNWCRNMLNYLN